MFAASADSVAAVHIQVDSSAGHTIAISRAFELDVRTPEVRIPEMVRVTSEAYIKEVRPISAGWLQAVTQRITDSIAASEKLAEEDLRWLNPDVADAARDFFANTSDLLPCEPYIYRSRKGELVAEFETNQGSLTTVISQTKVIAFAARAETILEAQLELGAESIAEWRDKLNRMTVMLLTGQMHGDEVEPTN